MKRRPYSSSPSTGEGSGGGFALRRPAGEQAAGGVGHDVDAVLIEHFDQRVDDGAAALGGRAQAGDFDRRIDAVVDTDGGVDFLRQFKHGEAGGSIEFDTVKGCVVKAEERFPVKGSLTMGLLGQETPVALDETQEFRVRILETPPASSPSGSR